MTCERCYQEAKIRAVLTGKEFYIAYQDVMREREDSGNVCTPEERAGQFWDAENKVDRRSIK